MDASFFTKLGEQFTQNIVADNKREEAEQLQKDAVFKEFWRTVCSPLKEHWRQHSTQKIVGDITTREISPVEGDSKDEAFKNL